ncbi:hypothetical protein ACH4OW_38070 [Streptomyces sp. NPDC017056]|uniref:hypothetical protein n=1 Tax=Streptomyces sp. NPDC017056 TaxID=3364973 RepID=UPI00379FCBCB
MVEWCPLADHRLGRAASSVRNSSRGARRRLQHQVDAAPTVIAALLAENAALREQAANRPAGLIPLTRPGPAT